MVRAEPLERFKTTLKSNMALYGLDLSNQNIRSLADYYALLTRWNDRLHLVAPCSAEEFATRHVLESLMLLPLLPTGTSVADIGSGAGLPIIPCLIVRADLSVTLIESSPKKSVFLREALKQIGMAKNSHIIAKPFEETTSPDVSIITCRALDEFSSKLPALIKWAPPGSTLLLFGGETLREVLEAIGTVYTETLIPRSGRRFLFEVRK